MMQLAMRVRGRWPVWLNAAVAVCGDAYAGFLVLGGMQRALTSGDLTVFTAGNWCAGVLRMPWSVAAMTLEAMGMTASQCGGLRLLCLGVIVVLVLRACETGPWVYVVAGAASMGVSLWSGLMWVMSWRGWLHSAGGCMALVAWTVTLCGGAAVALRWR